MCRRRIGKSRRRDPLRGPLPPGEMRLKMKNVRLAFLSGLVFYWGVGTFHSEKSISFYNGCHSYVWKDT